jgi:hypothetical protein
MAGARSLPTRQATKTGRERLVMESIWLFLTLVATTAIAGSGGVGAGTVTGFIPGNVVSGASVFVVQTGSNQTLVSSNSTQRFAISSSNPQYNGTMAAATSAYASGSSATAVGLGSCSVVPNAEDLNYVCVGAVPS